jgi:hypothetical protein
MDEDKVRAFSWNSQLEKVISDEGERALCYAWLHDKSEKRYSKMSTYITLPSIMLATISGSASIGIGQFIEDSRIGNILIGVTTLSVAILTTVSSYFAWAKRCEGHRIATISYKKVHRFILIELALPRSERMSARDMLKIVRDESQRMEEMSPQIPDSVIAVFKEKFGKTTPEVTKPEITNGLDPIYVYPSNVDSPGMKPKSGHNLDDLTDPMYRTPKPEVIIPTFRAILKTSNDDHTPNSLQRSSSVHPLSVSASDNNHI